VLLKAMYHTLPSRPAGTAGEAAKEEAAKVIIEHTNINPTKPPTSATPNAILGDTFVRMLRATRRIVEVQNYIDNTGVQVATSSWLQALEHKTPPKSAS